MTDEPKGKSDETSITSCPDKLSAEQEEAEIKAILEQARQNVKHLAKEELEGERITQELLNFRMKVVDGHRSTRT